MDDWTMMLTMVATPFCLNYAPLAHSHQGLLIPLSALSVVCKILEVDENECALTFRYSGRHRSRQGYVDTSIRQYHSHSLRWCFKSRSLSPPADVSLNPLDLLLGRIIISQHPTTHQDIHLLFLPSHLP